MEKLKSLWEKVKVAVKSSPATFGYGVLVGLVLGSLFL